ncbi:MAG: hypothetical protein KKH12_14870 [Gammaproteobacteria bacterium]|nr:hypothetical protein [Gammaproteobacteria bacterium]MBU1482944.1 hypothetical protein [Gammaproteobacteria bacterium]
MTNSIFEQSDGTSYVVVTGEAGEHQVVEATEAFSREELAQIDVESFLGNVVFNYTLLGDPDADGAEVSDEYDVEDEYI